MPTSNSWKKVKRFLLDKRVALFAMLFTVLFVAKFQSNKWHEWDNPEKTYRPIVRSDGAGYYAFLPQAFIYQDRQFQFVEKMTQKYPEGKMGEFHKNPNTLNERTNKYFVGVAICQAPFFLAAHVFKGNKYPSDGYSLPYQKSVAIGAIFFLLLGLWLSYLVLLHFRIKPWIAAFTLTSFAIGSTLFYYSINEPLTAHLYSFAFVSMFFYALIRWKGTKTLRWLLLVIFSYALVILLRPSNGIVFILVFALFSSIKETWSFLLNNFFKKPKSLILGLLLFAGILFIQFANVKFQSGHWGFNIYGQEGFDNWNKPPFKEVLFGFRKGLFIYTPIFLLSLFGFWFIRKEHAVANRWILTLLGIFTYVTASWWCWWYGGSIGMRPFIDVSIFFMLGLAFLIQYARNWLLVCLFALIGFCLYFQFILTIQLETGILHFAEMNKEKFMRIFLKTDNRFQWVFHLDEPKSLDKAKNLVNVTNRKIEEKGFKLIPFEKRVEHMKFEIIQQRSIDEKIKASFGLRLKQNYTITDKHNLPWIYWSIKKDGEWKNVYIDLIGMRIPSLNKSYPVDSDLFLTPEIKSADSLRISLHNTNGLTIMEGYYADRLTFFKKK